MNMNAVGVLLVIGFFVLVWNKNDTRPTEAR